MKRKLTHCYTIISSKPDFCNDKFHTIRGAMDWIKENALNLHCDGMEFRIEKIYVVERDDKPMSVRYSKEELEEAARFYPKVLDYVSRGKTITAAIQKYKLDRIIFYCSLTELQRSELSHTMVVSKKLKHNRSRVPDVKYKEQAFEAVMPYDDEDLSEEEMNF